MTMYVAQPYNAVYKLMSDFLIENGWETLWHKDNWIKTEWWKDPARNVDTCGYSTKAAYLKCKNDILYGDSNG